jgi:hypothetical protein
MFALRATLSLLSNIALKEDLVHRLGRMEHGVAAETHAWRYCGLNHAFVSVH